MRRGRNRMEVTCKISGKIVFHKAGPANIVRGLWSKWLRETKQHLKNTDSLTKLAYKGE